MESLRKIALLMGLVVLLPMITLASAHAADYYFSASGGGGGTSCSDTLAIGNGTTTGASSSTYWVAGNTLHLCGTITVSTSGTGITGRASGTSGNPITIKFESGSSMTSGAAGTFINLNGNSYIVVDGNGTNPSMTNTANGTSGSYANQVDSSGIKGQPCNYCELKNLTINNIYVCTSTAETNGYGTAIWINGSNWSVHDNSFDGMYHAIVANDTSAASGTAIYNNTFNHYNWGVYYSPTGSTNVSNISIYNNNLKDAANWDTTSDSFHHDGLFIANNGSGIMSNIYMYNNLFNGNMGTCSTAHIYINYEDNGVYIFNNVMLTSGGSRDIYAGTSGQAGQSNFYILNNYVYGGSAVGNNSDSTCVETSSVSNVTIENNIIQGCSTYILCQSGCTGTNVINYNAYDTGVNTEGSAWNNGYATVGYSSWKSSTGFDANSVALSSLSLNASGVPQVGSGVIGAGNNLTSLGITALDSDIAGVLRPSSGAWDIGAYKYVPSALPQLQKPCLQSNMLSITASAGTNGSISPSGSVPVCPGNYQTFTITPKSGYTASVSGTCGGSLVGTTYTTNPVTGACTVSVTFQ